MTALFSNVSTAVTNLIGYFGQVVNSIMTDGGDLNRLLPLLGLGIGVTLFFAGIKVVRSFVFGG